MVRTLFSPLLCIVISLFLAACHYPIYGETITPNIHAARFNAKLGLDDLKHGDGPGALQRLHQALEQAPHDPVVLDMVGYYYEVLDQIDMANSYYAQAMLYAPNSGTITNNYGAFLCRHGYYTTSIPYFLKAAEIPHYAGAEYAYANARYCADQINEDRLGDKGDSAYYKRLLWSSPTITVGMDNDSKR